MQVPSWNVTNYLSLVLKSYVSQNIRKINFCFLGWISFIFQSSAEKSRVPFLEIQEMLFFQKIQQCLEVSKYGVISGPHFSAFGLNTGHFFTQCKKTFLGKALPWENIRNFLTLELESSISEKIRNFFWLFGGEFFFYFWGTGKCARWP